MGYPDALDPEDPTDAAILDFFTFRPCQPSYFDGQIRSPMWGWLAVYPQPVYTNADGTPEEIAVGVAQNVNAESAQKKIVSVMNGEGIFGRSYTSHGFDPRPDASLWGANFQEQWDRALKVDPEFVFVTGWNEWISGHRRVRCDVPNGFSDEFDDEHSRDCEPTKGKLKDHYYYQLCANIRAFKGVRSNEKHAEGEAAVYPDYRKDTSPRCAQGYYPYESDTVRNAVIASRVYHDAEDIHFEAECMAPVTPADANGWMRLLIRTRQEGASWEGFQYIVDRLPPSDTAALERSLGGWRWEKVCACRYEVDGRFLRMSVPRKTLGCEFPHFRIWFKWCDHNLRDGDILTLYTEGDASPGGRFAFSYEA